MELAFSLPCSPGLHTPISRRSFCPTRRCSASPWLPSGGVRPSHRASSVLMAAEERPSKAELAAMLGPGEVVVRFVNTEDDEDVVAVARPGENLLKVGDSAGVRIPRACQSGLCGSCTSDVVGLDTEGGVETVRACQTSVSVPEGELEMVVDVWRVKEVKGQNEVDPMARFENLDTEYVAGAAPRKKGWMRELDCIKCNASGDITCYNCSGDGVLAEDTSYSCPLCVGSGSIRCAFCQGTGKVAI